MNFADLVKEERKPMPKDYAEKIREIVDINDKLYDEDYINAWEQKFILDMDDRLKRWKRKALEKNLSDKQKAKIDTIYDKACGSPY